MLGLPSRCHFFFFLGNHPNTYFPRQIANFICLVQTIIDTWPHLFALCTYPLIHSLQMLKKMTKATKTFTKCLVMCTFLRYIYLARLCPDVAWCKFTKHMSSLVLLPTPHELLFIAHEHELSNVRCCLKEFLSIWEQVECIFASNITVMLDHCPEYWIIYVCLMYRATADNQHYHFHPGDQTDA